MFSIKVQIVTILGVMVPVTINCCQSIKAATKKKAHQSISLAIPS